LTEYRPRTRGIALSCAYVADSPEGRIVVVPVGAADGSVAVRRRLVTRTVIIFVQLSEHDDRNRIGASTLPMDDGDKPLRERHCLVVWVEGIPTRWPLPARGDVIIGRDAQADVRVDSRAVSRRHARLHLDGPGVRISDLESRNSTRLNGQLVSGEQSLAYGDVVALGDVVAVLEGVPGPGENAAGQQLPADGLEMSVGVRTLLIADPLMVHVFAQLRRLAASNLAVLVVGETGTGKDLAAEVIHAWSHRASGPFVSVNCAALPEPLAESELFGHDRGAFSGAASDKPGLFESAGGGTLFLDEIGELPRTVQPKLLRVLESRRVTRLGVAPSPSQRRRGQARP
jgi:Sigma-54 interaction domain/FHA domain